MTALTYNDCVCGHSGRDHDFVFFGPGGCEVEGCDCPKFKKKGASGDGARSVPEVHD